jgi:hypothetical protein
MIEYILIGKNNRSVTIYNFEETNKSIETMFPQTETNKTRGGLRRTYGKNGEEFYVYYGENGSKIFLPNDEESIKEKLEVVAELKFEIVKCQ